MSAARSSVDQHQGHTPPLFFHVEITSTHINFMLHQVEPITPSGNIGNFVVDLFLKVDDAIEDALTSIIPG